MLSISLAALMLAAGGTHVEEGQHCPAQPLPPPIAVLAPVPEHTNAITFSAAPSLEYPRGAWVVRLSPKSFTGPAAVEIARLRAQSDCNRYDIVKQWEASMPAEDFEALAKQVVTLALPDPELFGPGDPLDRIIGLDGTSIEVQMDSYSWKVSADLRNGGQSTIVCRQSFIRWLPVLYLRRTFRLRNGDRRDLPTATNGPGADFPLWGAALSIADSGLVRAMIRIHRKERVDVGHCAV